MKLVIDIPDEYYELYKDTNNNVSMNDFAGLYLLEIIRNGKPLPKGHGRLIDADALNFNADYNEPLISKLDFDNAPTIIEADKEEECARK